MSLDVTLRRVQLTEVYSGNMTHNMVPMAKAAGVYEALWRPEEGPYRTAEDLVAVLTDGLARLRAEPDKFVQGYLNACLMYPDASIEASR